MSETLVSLEVIFLVILAMTIFVKALRDSGK